MSDNELEGRSVRLGALQVGEEIGRGGFGVVHAATIDNIRFDFAIKFLDPSPFNSDPALRARFFREAELLLKLRHPHIVGIHGMGQYNETPYILMERFKGIDLREARLRRAPADRVLGFVDRVASALAFAHDNGVIHRDIKPSNLMTARGDARVLDFGVAALIDPDAKLTRTGASPVGDAFSAPELLEDPESRDPRHDIYSLGACWFWLLTGKAPKGLSWESELRRAVRLSRDYEHVLLKTLAQANSRYPAMDDLLHDIRALKVGTSPAVSCDDLRRADELVLATLVSVGLSSHEGVNLYMLEQELGKAAARFEIAMALRKLCRLGLACSEGRVDVDGQLYSVYQATESGADYAERHYEQFSALLADAEPKPARWVDGLDDIPF